MALERDDLDGAIIDSGLLNIIKTGEPAALTREGLDHLFFICAVIDDPEQTDGVRIEINYDSSGNAESGNFFVHSFGILSASALGEDFFPLVNKAWQGGFTTAAYTESGDEDGDGDDSYTVLPFGTDDEYSGEADAIIVQVMDSLELQEALRASLVQSACDGEGPQMLRDYCQAVLVNLSASSSA